MSCKGFKKQLDAYALNLLSSRDHAALKKHLDGCSHCQSRLKQHQQAAGLLHQAYEEEVPDYLQAKVMANLKTLPPTGVFWPKWALPGALVLMALVLMVRLEPGRMLKQDVLQPSPTTAPTAVMADVVKAAAGRPMNQPQSAARHHGRQRQVPVKKAKVRARLSEKEDHSWAEEMPYTKKASAPSRSIAPVRSKINRPHQAPGEAALSMPPAPAVSGAESPRRRAKAGQPASPPLVMTVMEAKGFGSDAQVQRQIKKVRPALAAVLQRSAVHGRIDLVLKMDAHGRVVETRLTGNHVNRQDLQDQLNRRLQTPRFTVRPGADVATLRIKIIVP